MKIVVITAMIKRRLLSVCDKYKVKYPQYHALYTNMPDEVLVIATPTKFSLYKYIDGKPCIDVLNVAENKAYREVLV